MSNATNTSYAGSPAPTPSVAPIPESTRDVISFIGGLVAAIIVALLFLSWVGYLCRKKYLREREVEARRRAARSSVAVPSKNPSAELTARVPKKAAAVSAAAGSDATATAQKNPRRSMAGAAAAKAAAAGSPPAVAPMPGPPQANRRKSRLPGPPPLLPGPPPALPGPPPSLPRPPGRRSVRLSRLPGPPPLPGSAAVADETANPLHAAAAAAEADDAAAEAGDLSTWGDREEVDDGDGAIGLAEDPGEAAADAGAAGSATEASADGQWQWNEEKGWQWVANAQGSDGAGTQHAGWQWNDDTGWVWVGDAASAAAAAEADADAAEAAAEVGWDGGDYGGGGSRASATGGDGSPGRRFVIGQGTRIVEKVEKQTVTLRRVSVIRGDTAMTQQRKGSSRRLSRGSVADGFAAASVSRPSMAPHSAHLSAYAFTATVARAKLRVPSNRESSATSLSYRPSGVASGSASPSRLSAHSSGYGGSRYDDGEGEDGGGFHK